MGKMGVSPRPMPFQTDFKMEAMTRRPSALVSVPKFTDVNGTWAPARECMVFRLWMNASMACSVSWMVSSEESSKMVLSASSEMWGAIGARAMASDLSTSGNCGLG